MHMFIYIYVSKCDFHCVILCIHINNTGKPEVHETYMT